MSFHLHPSLLSNLTPNSYPVSTLVFVEADVLSWKPLQPMDQASVLSPPNIYEVHTHTHTHSHINIKTWANSQKLACGHILTHTLCQDVPETSLIHELMGTWESFNANSLDSGGHP